MDWFRTSAALANRDAPLLSGAPTGFKIWTHSSLVKPEFSLKLALKLCFGAEKITMI